MIRFTLARTAVMVIALLAGSAWAAPPEPGSKTAPRVTGLLVFKERLEFPAGTRIEVTLRLEGQRMNAEPIGKQTILAPQVAPIPFAVAYNPADIESGKRYVIHARIFRERGVRYASIPDVPVITRGNPSKDIVVRMVESDRGVGETSY
jgi:uncharacterized lipoprotein YbaY